MPLIWNDDQYTYIDDQDDFDRSQYVIARKIFIRFKEDAKVTFKIVSLTSSKQPKYLNRHTE